MDKLTVRCNDCHAHYHKTRINCPYCGGHTVNPRRMASIAKAIFHATAPRLIVKDDKGMVRLLPLVR